MNFVYEKDYTNPPSRKIVSCRSSQSSFITCVHNVLKSSGIEFTTIVPSENESAWCQPGFYLVTENEHTLALVQKCEVDVPGWIYTNKTIKSTTLKRWRLIPVVIPITFTVEEEINEMMIMDDITETKIETENENKTETSDIDTCIPQMVALTFEDGEVVYAEEVEEVESKY